jgi:hypothetical protein
MDNDHEAYPEEMTLDDYVDHLTDRERQGNMLYEIVMRTRQEQTNREEEERCIDQKKYRAWVDKVQTNRLAVEREAKCRGDEQPVTLGEVGMELSKGVISIAAVGVAVGAGVVIGLCQGLFGSMKDKR